MTLAEADVPSEVGSTVGDAESAIAAAGFKPAVTRVASDQPIDTVIAQNPSGGQARKGSTVELSVSEGPQPTTEPATTVTVPETTGTTTTP